MRALFGFCLLFWACLASFSLMGQVTTIPAFPEASQELRIRYDASAGNTGLVDADQVYIHLGAVTEGASSTAWDIVPFQWGTKDPEAQMTKVEGEAQVWEFVLTPSDFFALPAGKIVYRLGMVFRNGDGTKEGKSSSNGDFFVNLAQGFELRLNTVGNRPAMIEVGETIELEVLSSKTASISLKANAVELASVPSGTVLSYSYLAQSPGLVSFEATAQAGEQSANTQLELQVYDKSAVLALPEGRKKGINYLNSSTVSLVLEAPGKRNVFVLGDFNDWQVNKDYRMNKTPDGEMFWIDIEQLVPGQEYRFQYLVDGEIKIADPYTDKVADPYDDAAIIEEGRYPGLMPYPEGQEFQLSYLQTDQLPYVWQNTDYAKPEKEELLIYELLVRDFEEERSYTAVTDKLDYLQELGVNAIQLMPINEFEGNLSWGYNPSFYFAPDKYYGSKDELKALIDAAHGRGMVVLLDMVLNHAFGQSPLVRLYNEGDYGAPDSENPWLNTSATHPYNVGYDFNHESHYTQALVDSVTNYWVTEYHVDGYRFDLSKGFTQVYSGEDVNKWSQKDESRIAIWKRIYDEIQKDHPGTYVILEHLSENSEEKILSDYGMMFWGNMNHTFRQLIKGGQEDFSYAYYLNRGWSDNHLISYMESHDEERLMWEVLNYGDRSIVDLRALPNAVNRAQLLAAFYLSIPGPKMIWQFGEMAYDEELNNDRLGMKPAHWDYLEDPDRARLFLLYRTMLHLRNSTELFGKEATLEMNVSGKVKWYKLKSGDQQMVLVGNYGLTKATDYELDMPDSDQWYDHISGEEVRLGEDNSLAMDLGVNEYRLLLNWDLDRPEGMIHEEDLITALPEIGGELVELKIYPVPSEGDINVVLPRNITEFSYRVVDMSGKVWIEGRNYQNDNNLGFQLKDIRAGLYIFELTDNSQVLRKQFIIK